MQKNNGKIKVLFLLAALHEDGAVLSSLTTLKHLDPSRFQPQLFVLKQSPGSEEGSSWNLLLKNLDIEYGMPAGKKGPANVLQLLRKLYRLAKQSDIIVGGLEMTPTFLAVIMGRLLGKPSVGFIRNSLPDLLAGLPRHYTYLTKFIYPWLTEGIAISNGIKQGTEKLLPELQGRISTVYIPIDIDQIRGLSETPLPQAENRPPYLLAVGRLMPQKGFDILLQAYAIARQKGINQELVIVGKGEERRSLEKLVNKLKLNGHVHLAGFQENPYAWMRNADLFVSSSRFEGFCRVLAEAQAIGTAVISTDCPDGPAEVLEGGKSGILVQNENPEALAEGMVCLLRNPALMQKLRLRATERVKEFTLKATINSFEEILLNLQHANTKSV